MHRTRVECWITRANGSSWLVQRQYVEKYVDVRRNTKWRTVKKSWIMEDFLSNTHIFTRQKICSVLRSCEVLMRKKNSYFPMPHRKLYFLRIVGRWVNFEAFCLSDLTCAECHSQKQSYHSTLTCYKETKVFFPQVLWISFIPRYSLSLV